MNILGFSGSTTALIAVAIAFVPAAVVFVRGRQVHRFVDDPALPERLFAGRRVTTQCFAFTIVALVRLAPADAIRVAGPNGAHAHLLAVSDRAAAGVWYERAATSTIRIDPIDQGVATSTIRIYPID